MEVDVAPLLHKYVFAPAAVKVTEPPEQNVVGPLAETVTGGIWFNVTCNGPAEAVHPAAEVPVTVYGPLANTTIALVVALVFQR
jgi:hypothetical protein